jgi:hypothetical protein
VTLRLQVVRKVSRGRTTGYTAASLTLHAKPVIVGQKSVEIPAGQTETVHVALNRTGGKLVHRYGRLEVALVSLQSSHPAHGQVLTFTARSAKRRAR